MIKNLKRLLCAGTTIAGLSLSATTYAQNTVVVVPLFDTSPTGVAAIPFYCAEIVAAPDDYEVPNCYRSDTRELITPVPSGHFMFITDLHMNRNSLDNSGNAFIYMGRNAGGAIPADPSMNFSVDDLVQVSHLTWTTPRIILHEGESLAVYSSNSSTRIVDMFFTGYLVKAEGFGK